MGAHNSVVGADQGFRAPVGAHNSVVSADQGFRAPSGDQESERDVCVAEMVVLSADPAD